MAALDVPASAAIDVVGRLAGRSLLIVDDVASMPTNGGSGRPIPLVDRYRLLDSIRAFALEALTEAGLTDAFAAHVPQGHPAAGAPEQSRTQRKGDHHPHDRERPPASARR